MAEDQISVEDFKALQKQLGALTKKVADLQTENVTLKQERGDAVTILPPGEAPVYELSAPYFSPDDVWYPEGAQIEDITGLIVPNESMVPLNAAAERRVRDWQDRLPGKDRTPPLELIVQAAVEMRPKEGDAVLTHVEFQKAVMHKAIELHYERLGMSPAEARKRPTVLPARPNPNVPLMSNTRINGQVRQPAPLATRLHGQPVSPADKAAPPVGTSHTTNLGRTANPGVAAR